MPIWNVPISGSMVKRCILTWLAGFRRREVRDRRPYLMNLYEVHNVRSLTDGRQSNQPPGPPFSKGKIILRRMVWGGAHEQHGGRDTDEHPDPGIKDRQGYRRE